MENEKIQVKAIAEPTKILVRAEQTPEIVEEMKKLKRMAQRVYENREGHEKAWSKVMLARMTERPRANYYLEKICDEFLELHGDRTYSDDPAIRGGIARIGTHVVTIIAQSRGVKAKENMRMNFGMAHPEGYRKALRLMKQAEKFKRPVICLIDTPGAYCGIGAEERGQGQAIAQNLFEMTRLKVPIISGIIGEGGSGGALALGIADKIFMQEHAVYSILSPEGFASILWKDATRAQEAAEKMKLTAQDLWEQGVIDDIILEPIGGAQKDPVASAEAIKEYVLTQLQDMAKVNTRELVEKRYVRFRKIYC